MKVTTIEKQPDFTIDVSHKEALLLLEFLSSTTGASAVGGKEDGDLLYKMFDVLNRALNSDQVYQLRDRQNADVIGLHFVEIGE